MAEETCEACNGTGYYTMDYYEIDYYYEASVKCCLCNGSGKIDLKDYLNWSMGKGTQ